MQSKGKPSRTKAERMMNLADELGDQLRVSTTAVGLHSLLAFVTEWIVSYEAAHVTLPTLSPVELLRSLMESNGLKQRDLAADLGGQPVVSAILNGRRTINARQAKALARRFNVDIAAFFEPDIEPEQRARLISGGPNAGRVRRENCWPGAQGEQAMSDRTAYDWIDDIERMQGGPNGPTIRLRACVLEMDTARKPLDEAQALELARKHLDQGLSWAPYITRCTDLEIRALIRAVEAAHGIDGA